jgi:hypothetical protein
MFQFLVVRNAWLFCRKSYARRRLPGAFARLVARSLVDAAALQRDGYTAAAEAVVSALVAILRRSYGRPRTTMCPPLVARFVVAHPWKMAFLLECVADWSDKLLGCRAATLPGSTRQADETASSVGAVEPQ